MAIEICAAKADDKWLSEVRQRVAERGAISWEEALLLILHIDWQADQNEMLAYQRDELRDELSSVPVH